MPVKATAKFLSKKEINPNIFEFYFEMDDPPELNLKSGQYITIIIDKKARRQYSIASSPENKKRFTLLVDISPGGVGTQYLTGLSESGTISFIGGIGLFVLPENLSPNLYFIATGTGIAPLRSMIDFLVSQEKSVSIHLVQGARTQQDIIYENVFSGYLEDRKISSYTVCLSREKNEDCFLGRVTDAIQRTDISKDAQYLICGGGDVVKSVEEILLEKGVSSSAIFYEKFY